MKLISWNVNGLRAVLRKNFLDYLDAEKPDVLCLQETRAAPDDVEQLWPATYTTYWNTAQKKGYAGTGIFTKNRPLRVTTGIGITKHDKEGRVLSAEFADFFLVNVYVPNSQRELTRLCGPRPRLEQLGDEELHQGRTGYRMDLGKVLTRVGPRPWPNIEIGR